MQKSEAWNAWQQTERQRQQTLVEGPKGQAKNLPQEAQRGRQRERSTDAKGGAKGAPNRLKRAGKGKLPRDPKGVTKEEGMYLEGEDVLGFLNRKTAEAEKEAENGVPACE
ncbi:MAG: hypothetical protein FRX49_00263 [Trebouxia sp. A1-2]|nr:MAG: hypothetical protein FRX49_00263 [Trebouxia sp. A1-2]